MQKAKSRVGKAIFASKGLVNFHLWLIYGRKRKKAYRKFDKTVKSSIHSNSKSIVCASGKKILGYLASVFIFFWK